MPENPIATLSDLYTRCIQSCERIRVTLEGFESANDIESFVKSYGTGNVIPGELTVNPIAQSMVTDTYRLARSTAIRGLLQG